MMLAYYDEATRCANIEGQLRFTVDIHSNDLLKCAA